MSRFERDLKKKVKNTKKDYDEWYSEHEQQIAQLTEEKVEELDLGSIKVIRRTAIPWIVGCVIFMLIAVITTSLLLNQNKSNISDFTFGEDEITEIVMSDDELGDVIENYPKLANLHSLTGIKILYNKDNSLVMEIVSGELETADDFYLINLRISYNDNFVFFDKWEYEDLENQTVINEIEIGYEDKGTDDYGMYLYYAVMNTGEATMYWSVSCIEGMFDEWLQIMFS